MQFALTEDQLAYKEAVRKFAESVLRPLVTRFDLETAEVRLTREEFALIRNEVRSHQIILPPEHEDGSADLIAQAIFDEEVWRISGALAITQAIHYGVGNPLAGIVQNQPFTRQQSQLYQHLTSSEVAVALCMSEPNVGSNPAEVQTKATRAANGWRISGTKIWCSNAYMSDGLVVVAQVHDPEPRGVGLYIVDRALTPYDPRSTPMLGLGSPTTEIQFDGLEVPFDALLGSPGRGLSFAYNELAKGRFYLAIGGVGLAQAALDDSLAYSLVRTQRGRPIAEFQLVQAMLADMATQVTAGRALAYHAIALFQAGMPARAEISMAKAWCTEMAVRVTSLGMEIQGAMGVSKENSAERYFRDARMTMIPEGTAQIQRLIIGRELTGVSAFA